ncbi:MAG: alpha/beta fold hydrolase [archaeon]
MIEMTDGKLVTFTTKDHFRLHGFLFKSKGKNKRLLIHQHGMTGNFFTWKVLQMLSKNLNDTGTDLFSANNRGFGFITSFYKENGNRKKIGSALEKFEDCLKDIEAAIEAGRKMGYKEFVLSGHSTGCQKIAHYMYKKKNPRVKALLLLAPADDYNLQMTRQGKRFPEAIKIAKEEARKENGTLPKWIHDFSPKRYLSVADLKNAEARLFDYSGEMKEFSKIRVPMLAIFGSKETPTQIKPKKMLEILGEKSKTLLVTAEIKGANHGFTKKEKELCNCITLFLKIIR